MLLAWCRMLRWHCRCLNSPRNRNACLAVCMHDDSRLSVTSFPVVPDTFASIVEYQATFAAAIICELKVRMQPSHLQLLF